MGCAACCRTTKVYKALRPELGLLLVTTRRTSSSCPASLKRAGLLCAIRIIGEPRIKVRTNSIGKSKRRRRIKEERKKPRRTRQAETECPRVCLSTLTAVETAVGAGMVLCPRLPQDRGFCGRCLRDESATSLPSCFKPSSCTVGEAPLTITICPRIPWPKLVNEASHFDLHVKHKVSRKVMTIMKMGKPKQSGLKTPIRFHPKHAKPCQTQAQLST